MAERPALPHIPHAELVSRALDGSRAPWDAEAARHLRQCGACRERLALYERAAAAGRLTRPGEVLQPPPAHVWTAVRSHLDEDAPRTPPPLPPPPAPAPRRAALRVLRRAAAAARALAHALARGLVRLPARLRPHRPRETDR
ncbi:hypothetical protein [Streptomyces hilarionis]|uniref:hypothetical protein n=1 Tax=Streptomyces hilarionis TaxID=2839954 RepID=UPI00211A2F91|nr:hypothetical protein [Streptomyces hilarionis]MCQ9132297.1 hypothetical protein [Streptomyces hilarionis]